MSELKEWTVEELKELISEIYEESYVVDWPSDLLNRVTELLACENCGNEIREAHNQYCWQCQPED